MVFVGEISFGHEPGGDQGFKGFGQFAVSQAVGIDRPPDAKPKPGFVVPDMR